LIGIAIVIVRASKKTSVAQSSAQNVAPHVTVGVPPALPIKALSWEDFECQVGEVYRRRGFSVRIPEALGADGGVDLRLRKDDEVILVQCKSSEKWKVGAPVVREFFGVLMSEGAGRGILISKGSFTRDAKEFAAGKPLELIDGTAWNEMVVQAENPEEDLGHLGPWLDQFVACASWTAAACPTCKSEMKLRSTKADLASGVQPFPAMPWETRRESRPARTERRYGSSRPVAVTLLQS
jgi:restriction system protein